MDCIHLAQEGTSGGLMWTR